MGIAEDIALYERELAELVTKYEQYFLGLEKREPLKLREQVLGNTRRHLPIQITNTMHRFRYNQFVAKYHSYEQYWNRTLRLIEEGKYSRDLFKMKLHSRELEEGTPPRPEKRDEGPTSQIERLYRSYLEARDRCGLPVDGITRDMIASAVDRHTPALMEKYGCRDVRFDVVIEEGKPKIKAKPRKG